jgi:M6 family metalloprotease-like protein
MYLKHLFIIAALLSATFANALQPPTAEQLARYKKQGTFQKKLIQAKKLSNYKISPNLSHRTKSYINDKLGIQSVAQSIPGHRGLPATGDVKTFTLLLDFPDAPAPAHQTIEVIDNHIYGEGLPERYPVESLTNFYKRSSYEQLNIGGNVIGWYTTPYPRTDITDARAVIKEALTHYESQGHDFSQYDNDGDGYIDYFSVVWTGEVGEWASLWWGWQSSFSDPSYTLSGKELAAFSWQWLSWNNDTDDFDPMTLIHETGHGLGLPDFYDYDGDIGPVGGVGGLDMMDATWGDHGAFSKFALGWIEPKIVSSGSQRIILEPSSSTKDALIIMPDLTLEKKYSEYFVVQNRDQLQNDKPLPNSGLLIWHVNAQTNQYGFTHDNSYSDNKLIRLMEADGLEQIEQGLGADANDYYLSGQDFTTTSTPDSQSYLIGGSGVEIKNITNENAKISFDASIAQLPEVIITNIEPLQILNEQQIISVTVSDSATINKVQFYLNNVLLAEDNQAPYEVSLDTSSVTLGEVEARVDVFTTDNIKNSTGVTLLKLPSTPSYLIVNLTPSGSADALSTSLQANGKTPISLTDFPVVTPELVPAIFINNTDDTDNISAEQVTRIANFIDAGGHVYYENGYWYWANNENMTNLASKLGVEVTNVFSQDLMPLSGAESSVMYGIEYTPEFIDNFTFYTQIVAASSVSTTKPVWQLASQGFNVAISNQISDSKLIASTARFADIPVSQRQLVMSHYLTYFDQDTSNTSAKVNVAQTQVSNTENGGGTNIELVRNFDDLTSSRVNLKLEGLTAVEGLDYQPLSVTTIEFLEGMTSYHVPIVFINNGIDDGDRQLKLIIEGDNVGTVTESLITIINEDDAGKVNFVTPDSEVTEDTNQLDFTVIRTGDGITPHQINIKTVDNSAIADINYEALDFDYTFADNEFSKTFSVNLIDNNIINEDIDFHLEIESMYKADDYLPLLITIKDNDVRGTIKYTQSDISISENSGAVEIEILRVNGSDDVIDFTLTSIGGTAVSGTDFTAFNENLTFAVGETSKKISINIIDNNLIDATRQFTLSLESEYLAETAQILTVTITNDDIAKPVEPINKDSSGGGLSIILIFLTLLVRRRSF